MFISSIGSKNTKQKKNKKKYLFFSCCSTEEFIKELPNWKVGDKVQAQFSEDGVFYEAEIKSIKDGLYHVLYTEFGNEEDVGIAALKESANPAAVAAVSAPAPVAAAPVVEESSGWGAPVRSEFCSFYSLFFFF